jgi:Icc-related predicted phosphoesterase
MKRLEGMPYQVHVAPSSEDWLVIDDMIGSVKLVHPCDARVVEIDHHEMITSSDADPTPWDAPREMSEEDLENKLRTLCALVKNHGMAINSYHVPPCGYSLDLCPRLDEDLTVAADEKTHAGSIGAERVIEELQRCSGCTVTPKSRAASRRRGVRCSSTRAASARRASSRT